MSKITQLFIFSIFLFANSNYSQDLQNNDADKPMKDILAKKVRFQTLNYNKKQYDSLFFDYIKKTNNPKLVLTKEEYYNFTVRIGVYAEKLGLLYKSEKAIALKTKQEWLDKKYMDYLSSKQLKK
jgi:hypothetical protein